jgi:hypothetical protein
MIRSVALSCTLALIAAAAPASAQESDQVVLTRNVLEAIRTNTAALQRNAQIMETFSNRLERVEAATRTIPPSVEGLRTDIIAIRAGLDRLVAGAGQRRPAASLRFAPFACGNESEAACAVNACKSVGYGNGFALAVNRTGTGANVRPSSVGEATCYD